MTDPQESNRTALVTGASSGIGAAITELLVERRWHVITVARDAERLSRQSLRFGTEPLQADLLTDTGVGAVERRVRAGLGLLVNNAGFTTYGQFAELDLRTELEMLALHAQVPMRLCHAAAQSMQAGGRIANIASMAGLSPAPGLTSYAASKAALISLSESLHHELKPKGITVTCVCAGYTRTELQSRANVDASRLPDLMWTDAEFVAREALRASERGRSMAIPGRLNTLTSLKMRLMPRRLATSIAAGVVSRIRQG